MKIRGIKTFIIAVFAIYVFIIITPLSAKQKLGIYSDQKKNKKIYIDLKAFKCTTPGLYGIPLPRTVVAGNSKRQLNRLLKKTAGIPKKIKIDLSRLRLITPGENNVPLVKSIKLSNINDITHSRPVLNQTSSPVQYPLSVTALPLRYKDTANFDIQYLDVDQGLSSSNILSILADRRGRLWFGTEGGGIVCYDGISFLNYTRKEGLVNNIVWSIVEDKNGHIWLGTNGGVSCYDGHVFRNITVRNGLPNNRIVSLLVDSKGYLWFGTNGSGVCRFKGGRIQNYTKKEGLPNNHVISIFEDSQKNLWFGTNDGISRFDGKSFLTLTRKEGLPNNRVRSILEDGKGRLWFGTEGGGVCCYDGMTIKIYTKKEGLIHNSIWSMTEDSDGNIWFGSLGGGISRFDGRYFSSFTFSDGLSDDNIWSMLEDSTGNLWFGTYGGGVNRFKKHSFINMTVDEGLSNSVIVSMMEDRSGNLWFGTYGGGVCRYDGQSFSIFSKNEGLGGNIVWSIREAQNGDIWFGTNTGGVSRYDGKTFRTYTKVHGLATNMIWEIIQDRAGNLWLSTYRGGVSFYDGTSFRSISKKDGLGNNRVTSMYEDSQGLLWFGTYGGGISLYDGESIQTYSESDGLADSIVVSIYEDTKGNMLFGTYGGGLSLYNRKSFKTLNTQNGLIDNKILSIIRDNRDGIWLSSEKGLNYLKFGEEYKASLGKVIKTDLNFKNESLNRYSIDSFGRSDGLKAINFYTNSACIDSKNRIWWGSGKALTMLDLQSYKSAENRPIVHLNRIDINGQYIDFRSLAADIKHDEISETSGNDKKIRDFRFTEVMGFTNVPLKLELSHELNHLTFHFSAIDWNAPHKIQYRYILEGLDQNWSDLTREPKAEYRNLPYGTFHFKVKAIGAAKIWSESVSYTFRLRPPWWFSWWAFIAYGILILMLIWFIMVLNSYRLIQQRNKLEKIVRTRTKELKESNEKLIELDQFKEGMTSMMVHDLKNPLNGILNLTDQEISGKQLGRIKQTGRQILNMVMNILDVYKFEESRMVLDKQPYDLNQIASQSIMQVDFLSQRKNIQIENSIAPNTIVSIDPELIERVMVNILTNGIKFSPNNKVISIQVCHSIPEAYQSSEYIGIRIRDEGEGIPEDKISSIFNKFGQLKVKSSGRVRSTGLGLTFCKMAIEAHGGNIWVVSSVGNGAMFGFTLPVISINGNTSVSDDKRSFPIKSDLLFLNDKEKLLLKPYLETLKHYLVYETSDIKRILDQIVDHDNNNIVKWKNEIRETLYAMNEERYRELLAKIE